MQGIDGELGQQLRRLGRKDPTTKVLYFDHAVVAKI